eukprot:9007939-Pyramimonas_sp.AAC.1
MHTLPKEDPLGQTRRANRKLILVHRPSACYTCNIRDIRGASSTARNSGAPPVCEHEVSIWGW